ncbi:MAG: universal stress protein [Acidimicrobiales bacterium]
MAYTQVIVGTDGSETAELAVRHAGRLAASAGARLVVLSAYERTGDELARSQADDLPDDIRWTLTDRAQAENLAARGRELATAEGAPRVSVRAEAGQPAEVLIGAAKELTADLIIVGSKGLTSPARYVLGSVAGSVAHHAPCDVLIVHTV